MIQFSKAIETLKNRRKAFVSEADLQLELAQILKELNPKAFVRCEYVPIFDDSMHIDILVISEGKWYPIELKYKTKSICFELEDELYNLKNQGAQDIGKYLYLKDIMRIEKIRTNKSTDFGEGYCLFITNDLAYTNEPTKRAKNAVQFALAEGYEKMGKMDWAEGTSDGTKKGHEEPIAFESKYTMHWEEFSEVDVQGEKVSFVLLNTTINMQK